MGRVGWLVGLAACSDPPAEERPTDETDGPFVSGALTLPDGERVELLSGAAYEHAGQLKVQLASQDGISCDAVGFVEIGEPWTNLWLVAYDQPFHWVDIYRYETSTGSAPDPSWPSVAHDLDLSDVGTAEGELVAGEVIIPADPRGLSGGVQFSLTFCGRR